MGIVDDIKDGLTTGLKVGEDLIHEGKKKLGEGADYATGKVGDGLDHVGLHGAADAVEAFGDELASDLGATPGEQQLGQTEEANELIHGNPGTIRDSAKHLRDFQAAFDKVGTGMNKVDSSNWKGAGGDAFREKFGVHPTKWLHAADACEAASAALESYAETVKWAQTQAQEAINLYKQGKTASVEAVDAYNKKVDSYNARIKAGQDPGPQPAPFHDPGIADMRAAREKLTQARKQRNSAAAEAQSKVKAALAHAPAEPPPLDRLGNNLVDGYQAVNTEVTHVVGGALKGTAGLLNFVRGVNPLDPYNLTHPAAYVQNINMTLAGLVSTAAHPERVVQGVVDGFKKDPSEFVGRLIPELIGTKGAGLGRTALRTGIKEGLEGGAANGGRLIPELIGTKGAGLGGTALRTGLKEGPEGGATAESPESAESPDSTQATETDQPDGPVESAQTAESVEPGEADDKIQKKVDRPPIENMYFAEGRELEELTYGDPINEGPEGKVPLFDGPPTREQAAQGRLGDCGVIASIRAVAGHRPEAIENAVRENPDGTYTVTLHDTERGADGIWRATGRRIELLLEPDLPVIEADPDVPAFARLEGGTAWGAVLEKAMAGVDQAWDTERMDSWQTTWQEIPKATDGPSPVGYERLNQGSSLRELSEMLTQLTGEDSAVYRLPQGEGGPALEGDLQKQLAEKKPILAASRPLDEAAGEKTLPHKLMPGHAYEVVGAQGGMVHLRNPWNMRHPEAMKTEEFIDHFSNKGSVFYVTLT